MLTKGGGNGEFSMSTRAAPMICPYVSQMSFLSVAAICFVYKSSASADVYIVCFLHCTASVGHVSDELTLALCFAIVFCSASTTSLYCHTGRGKKGFGTEVSMQLVNEVGSRATVSVFDRELVVHSNTATPLWARCVPAPPSLVVHRGGNCRASSDLAGGSFPRNRILPSSATRSLVKTWSQTDDAFGCD